MSGTDDGNRTLELRFHEAMIGVYEDAKSRVGYIATRFLQMVRRRGGLDAARRLLAEEGVSAGFIRLPDAGALPVDGVRRPRNVLQATLHRG